MADTTEPFIQAYVDRQIMEQGAFTPLEFLLDNGRLMYSDYESWRRGEVELLEEMLLGNADRIRPQLQQAAAYARRIGLAEDIEEYYPWQRGGERAATAAGDGGRPLRASADRALDQLLCCRFSSRADEVQLDIFFDNPVVALSNGIAAALAGGNLAEAERQLDQLYQQAPSHADLAAFDRLVSALRDLDQPIADVRQELEFLLQLDPVARRLLSSQSRDFLVPLWRRLAESLSDMPYRADNPQLHASFALGRAQQWQAAGQAVRAVSDWRRHPPLCLRLAESGYRRRNRAESLEAWCQLCWHAPQQAAQALDSDRQADAGMRALWQQFLDTEDDLALPAPLSDTDFPAWLLLTERGLVHSIPAETAAGTTPGETCFRLAHALITAGQAGDTDREMDLRRQLLQHNQNLFNYLKQRI